MKTLIVENEIYLAQSISTKLSSLGYDCYILNQVENNIDKDYDLILLSSQVEGFSELIEKHKDSIIILLVNYISQATVTNPIKLGASDYMQKPFMIEELVRKITHFQDYKRISLQLQSYKNYIRLKLDCVKIPSFDYKKIKLPILVKANKQIIADKFVYNYLNEFDNNCLYIDLDIENPLEEVQLALKSKVILYLSNYQALKEEEQDALMLLINKKRVIIHSSTNSENCPLKSIDLINNEKTLENSEILTVKEYVKHIITSYQYIFPDTDLSKKLGISRKSLWEKRKKYGIAKKK